jgi:S1-C subfamily serine protease
MSDLLVQLAADLAAVSEVALRSLVRIRNGREGVGAGAIWHANGLIVTNYHVVEGYRRHTHQPGALFVVLPDGRQLPATVLASNATTDLAALCIQATDLPPITLGDSQQLQAGQLVLALGFPWGVAGGATTGVLIGSAARLPEGRGDQREWLAASLHLRPGHSGGPMVDTQGRLIGINTMMNGPDVGVAVPVHVAKAFLRSALAPPDQGRVFRV